MIIRTENKQLRHDNQTLSRQLDKCRERLTNAEKHQADHENLHKRLRDKVTQLDEENRNLNRQVSLPVWATNFVTSYFPI